jgi:hypothetical protein
MGPFSSYTPKMRNDSNRNAKCLVVIIFEFSIALWYERPKTGAHPCPIDSSSSSSSSFLNMSDLLGEKYYIFGGIYI